MESTLHRQLKDEYADANSEIEVPFGKYRIDVVRDGQLIEIQHASLSSIRDKIGRLIKQHPVLVVKPIIVRRQLVKLNRKQGKEVGRRLSPKRGKLWDLFDELIYFTRVFPHRNLSIEVPLIDIEEYRYPGHGRRRRWRKRDHVVQDRKLVKIHDRYCFSQPADFCRLLPSSLPHPFHTGQLAEALGIERWVAQRIAYCFRHMDVAQQVGKQGNARLYELCTIRRKKKPSRREALKVLTK
jgi:hypothetical protein